MTGKVPTNLFESAMKQGSVVRGPQCVVLTFDGAGAICTPTMSYKVAERWALAKSPTGNMPRDRTAFLAKIAPYVTRRGTSFTSSVGGLYLMAKLMMTMQGAGFTLTDWSFPPREMLLEALGIKETD